MIEFVKSWFFGRTQREQWMIGFAATLLAAIIAVYGLVLPGYALLNAAEQELDEATERRGRIVARASLSAAASRKITSATQGVADGNTLEAIIMESASASGFEITSGANTGTDEFAFRLASAKAGALLAWLTGLEPQGIEIAEIKMRKGDGGFISADVRLRKRL